MRLSLSGKDSGSNPSTCTTNKVEGVSLMFKLSCAEGVCILILELSLSCGEGVCALMLKLSLSCSEGA